MLIAGSVKLFEIDSRTHRGVISAIAISPLLQGPGGPSQQHQQQQGGGRTRNDTGVSKDGAIKYEVVSKKPAAAADKGEQKVGGGTNSLFALWLLLLWSVVDQRFRIALEYFF